MISFAEQLTVEVADRIACDPFFWDGEAVEVLALTAKERLSDLQEALARRTLCALVTVLEVGPKPGNRRSPLLLEAKVEVHCVEDRTLNGTGKTAESMAEAAAAALVCWQPESCEDYLQFEGISDVTTSVESDQNRRILKARFSGVAVTTFQPGQTAAPVISIVDDLAVIIGPENATIRYTLDGTRPTPNSPRYDSAMSVAAGQTLTARAWRAGERASLVSTYEA
jgi:hypothetical protein